MAGKDSRDGGTDALPDPPDAPRIERRLSLYTWQAVGMLLIALIPIAAVTGLLGDRWSRVSARAGALVVSASAPSLFRYKTINSITLHIRNDGATDIDSVHVVIDTAYLARFSTVNAVPSFTGAYRTSVVPLRAAESSLVTIQLQAERYGRHHGTVLIHAGPDSARIRLTTTVLP